MDEQKPVAYVTQLKALAVYYHAACFDEATKQNVNNLSAEQLERDMLFFKPIDSLRQVPAGEFCTICHKLIDINLAPNGKPKVDVELVGQDGNAFAIISRCVRAMRKAGWTTTEIAGFKSKAMSGNYDELLATVIEYCNDVSDDDADNYKHFYEDEKTN